MDGALDAVLPRPAHHLAGRVPVLDAAQAHLAEKLHAGLGQVLEVLLDHPLLEHRVLLEGGTNPSYAAVRRKEG